MFSGIIEQKGRVAGRRAVAEGVRLAIRCGSMAAECNPGSSVAINGVCLTVAGFHDDTLEFDVVPETLARTTLGSLSAEASVNLERCLRLGDRVDGHFVQGHVDDVGVVTRIDRGGEHRVWIKPGRSSMRCIIPKGSVCVEGVSLTAADVAPDQFSVALIPTTLEVTTLGGLRVGDRVNIETDMLVRAVLHAREMDAVAPVGERSGPRPVDLKEAGFA